MSTTTCPVCREVVHVYRGFLLRHGFKAHGIFVACSGSGTPISSVSDSCCCG